MKTDETIGCLYADNKNKIHAIMLSEEDLYITNFSVPNIYITLNAFKVNLPRRVNNISTFRSFYVDMDPYHLNLDLDETLLKVKNEFGKTVPYPTAVVKSGQGFYLIWFIDPVGVEYKQQWNMVQDMLISKLEHYGSDSCCRDAARVLRVPGSINAKPGVEREVVVDSYNFDVDYTIDDFINWFDVKPVALTKNTHAAKKAKQPLSANNDENDLANKLPSAIYNKNSAKLRAQDIETLMLGRGENIVGFREVGLFYYRYFLMMSDNAWKEALDLALNLNSKLHIPLSVNEVVSATKPNKNTLYFPRTETIIEKLKITAEEQTMLNVLISDEEKDRRQKNKPSRDDIIDKRKHFITELVSSNYKVVEICKILGISRTTFYNFTSKHNIPVRPTN